MESEHSETVAVRKRRALWPWVVSALVAIVFAVGLSFWWPMYRAGRVIEFLEENGGWCNVNYNHPSWTKYVLDKDMYHPWFDEMHLIDSDDVVVTESMLDEIRQFKSLDSLSIRVQNPPWERFSQFESLRALALMGSSLEQMRETFNVPVLLDHSEIPLVLSRADTVSTQMTPDDWKTFASNLKVEELALLGCRLEGCAISNNRIRILTLGSCEVDESFGYAISELKNLTRLTLYYSVEDSEFWKHFREHPTLTELVLVDYPVTESTWKGLCRIEGLRELYISFAWDANQSVVTPELDQLGPPLQPKGTFPTDDQWNQIAQHKNLERLFLENVLITEDLTQALITLPKLSEISFENVSVAGKDLNNLASLPILKHLALYNTQVTAAELKAFREKRPDVEIDHDIEGILSDRRAKQLINAGP